jgi:hypothetical protein
MHPADHISQGEAELKIIDAVIGRARNRCIGKCHQRAGQEQQAKQRQLQGSEEPMPADGVCRHLHLEQFRETSPGRFNRRPLFRGLKLRFGHRNSIPGTRLRNGSLAIS